MTREELEEAIEAASQALTAAAKNIQTADDYGDYVGNPGVRSCGTGSEQDERAFADARAAYIAAVRAKRRYVYGPAMRAYYAR